MAEPAVKTSYLDSAEFQIRNDAVLSQVKKRWPDARISNWREPKTSRTWVCVEIKENGNKARIMLTTPSHILIRDLMPADGCIEMLLVQLGRGEMVEAPSPADRELSDGEELAAELAAQFSLF